MEFTTFRVMKPLSRALELTKRSRTVPYPEQSIMESIMLTSMFPMPRKTLMPPPLVITNCSKFMTTSPRSASRIKD